MDNLTQRLQFYWRIRWLKRSVITLASTLAILLLIPFIIQFAMTHWLIKQGASDASIDDINFNPFAGSFEIRQLVFRNAEHPAAQLDKLSINLGMLDLLSGHIVITDVSIDGLQANITRDRDGTLNVNGLALNAAPDKTEKESEQPANPPDFGIERLHISSSHVQYQESDLQQQLDINVLNLVNIKSWDKNSLAELQADLKLNAGAIRLDVQTRLFSDRKLVEGTFNIDGLVVQDYHKFFPPELTELSASLSLDSVFEVQLGDTISAKLNNKLRIDDLKARYQKLHPTFAQFNLEGESVIENIAMDKFAELLNNPQQRLDDQTLNLFSGNIALQQLTLEDDRKQQSRIGNIRITVDKLDALAQRYEIAKIDIDGIHSNIRRSDDGKINIDGIQLATTAAVTPPPGKAEPKQKAGAKQSGTMPEFSINHINIRQSDINYFEDGFAQNNHIDQLQISQIKSWDKELPAKLEIKAKLNKAVFQLAANLNLFDDIRQVRGNASLQQLAIEQYQKFANDYAQDLHGTLSLDTKFDVQLGEQVDARIDHHLQLQKLSLNYQNVRQQTGQIDWQGKAEITQNKLVSIGGDLEIADSKSEDLLEKYLIAEIGQLSIKGLRHDARQQTIQQLALENFKFLDAGKQQQFVTLAKLKVDDLNFRPAKNTLKIKQVTLAKPQANITLTDKKQLSELEPLLKTIKRLVPEEKPAPEKKSSATPLDINIDKIALSQSGSVAFQDHSVSPFYKTRIMLDQIDIRKLSNRHDGQFNLAFKQGDYTKISMQGDGLLLDPAQKLDLNAHITQLDLPPITPYTSHFMGYGMKSGVVDSSIKAKLEKRKIDALVKLKIDSIEVIETNKKTAEQVTSASGMSLDLAISSLKDKNNIIELKLPIKGNIDEPDFDLSLIINKAMGKAVKATTLAYLKNSLQPFGSLITLYSLAKAAADHISLPPVLFEVNSTEYQPQQMELLKKVIKVLNERPGLKIKACGVSVLADQKAIRAELVEQEIAKLEKARLADKKSSVEPIDKNAIAISDEIIQQKMIELADKRSARVKADFLKMGNLKPERILNCLSSTKESEETKHSVEILI
jgi:hypothetical protein